LQLEFGIVNPIDSALQFISSPNEMVHHEEMRQNNVQTDRKPIPIRNRSKIDKNGKELKRKRYNLLLLPSLCEDISKIAYVEKISINEAVNQAMVLYRDSKIDILNKYVEIEKLKSSYLT